MSVFIVAAQADTNGMYLAQRDNVSTVFLKLRVLAAIHPSIHVFISTMSADWMASHRLMLNPSKTDLLWCSMRGHTDGVTLMLRGVSVEPPCNLGVSLNEELTRTTHVNLLVGWCYRQLRIIRSCRRVLTWSAAVMMVNSFIVSRVDYCSSLLAACSQQQLDKLQRILSLSHIW